MTKRDEAETVWFLATRMTVLATAETTSGALGLIDALVPPGFSPPLHVHSREDELMYVIEGDVTFQVGDQRFQAGPGCLTFLPKGVPHTFRVAGDQPARMLELVLPGGFEHFHVDAGVPAAGPGFAPPSRPDVARFEELTIRYGGQHVGPPLTA
jgi:mannose-6-phosphate isomerase-like protein (cupin superfamily)